MTVVTTPEAFSVFSTCVRRTNQNQITPHKDDLEIAPTQVLCPLFEVLSR